MSLVYWLPMVSDELKNQGLSNATPVNNGTTVGTAGKLGKCRDFSGNAQYIDTGYKESFGTGDFTISLWAKLNVTSGKSYQPIISNKTTAAVSVGVSIYYNQSQNKFLWSTADGSGSTEIWTANTFSASTINGKWMHIVMVRNSSDPKKGYFYIDGVRQDLASVPAIRNVTNTTYNLMIGDIANHGHTGYIWTGSISDVRIYDEALSPKQIKLLSQGLVLHYPLSRVGGDNLYTGSKTFSGTWNNLSYWQTSSETYQGFTVKQKSSTWGGLSQNISCTNGDIFTISFYAKVQSGGRIASIHRSSLGNVSTGLEVLDGNFISGNDWITPTNDGTSWKKYWATLKIVSADITYLQWRIENSISNKTLYICGMKLEKGNKPTPWIPNINDSEYAEMGFNDGIEYDVSGYENNGIITGALSYTTDTPKYWTSTHISATNQKIHISNFPTSGFGNSYTFAWWGKRSSNSPMFWGFSNGVRLNGMYSGTLWNTGDGSNNPLYNIGTTTQVTAASVNVWHHYAMVGNGTKCYVYLDGVLWAEAKTYKSISGTSIYINGWDSGTTYCSDNTSISDFRIYTTALSADDILELYNTPVHLTSNGALLTSGEITEV